MTKILALSAALAALTLTASGASALECVNGYQQFGNGVIAKCEAGMAADAADPTEEAAIEADTMSAAPAEAPESSVAEAPAETPESAGSVAASAAEPEPSSEPTEDAVATARTAGPECVDGYAQFGNGVIFICGKEADKDSTANAASSEEPASATEEEPEASEEAAS